METYQKHEDVWRGGGSGSLLLLFLFISKFLNCFYKKILLSGKLTFRCLKRTRFVCLLSWIMGMQSKCAFLQNNMKVKLMMLKICPRFLKGAMDYYNCWWEIDPLKKISFWVLKVCSRFFFLEIIQGYLLIFPVSTLSPAVKLIRVLN